MTKGNLKFTVLSDNKDWEGLQGEWGLSIYIEYGDKKVLLDTGASNLYIENATKLGIDLSKVDMAVLSHGHDDHANGMPAFFEINRDAKFYLSEGCGENCFSDHGNPTPDYIGIPKDTLAKYKYRISYKSGKTEIAQGITLLTHSTKGLSAVGKRSGMYLKIGDTFQLDDYRHEQSLIFKTEKGLVVFNSCCHAGAPIIIHEVQRAFPGIPIIAIIGGFHLFDRTEDEVRSFAKEVKECGIDYVCTGHCTGEEAYQIIEEELGDTVHQLHCGLVAQW